MDSHFTPEQLMVLHHVSKGLIEGSLYERELEQVLEILCSELESNAACLYLYLRSSQELNRVATAGKESEIKNMNKLSTKNNLELVLHKLAPAGLSDKLFQDLQNPKDLSPAQAKKIKYLLLPVVFHEMVVGCLMVERAENEKNQIASELSFLQELAETIAPRLQLRQAEAENMSLQKKENGKNISTILGNSDIMRELARQISQVADSSTSVLITGETGTGKGLVAKEIHNCSPRKASPFVAINCGAIPENMIESELFGQEAGVGSPDNPLRLGRFEQAKGGTFFLDEVNELSPSLQGKLLRVLQDKELERVGAQETIKVNVRIIAASNHSLEKAVEQGRFRPELYFRLKVFPIHVPPLRERGADIMLLADFFTQRFGAELGKNIDRIDTPAIDMLMAYHWPGNVRELENTIERAVLLSEDQVIHGHLLPPSLQMNRYGDEDKDRGRFETLVENYERQLIIEALKDAWGNQTETAKLLGTTKRVVQYKIQKLNIDYKRFSRVGRRGLKRD